MPSDSDSPGQSDSEIKRALRNLREICQNPLSVLKLAEAIQRNQIRRKVHVHTGFLCPAEYTAIEI
ncbi:unnamed protein product [Penicillium roqueforti FM164]|uniref:Genomic scaffold, ProqFM164S02 n=1 Tax=Penicillium roqueforti (strain FM164) TaxID=1365484 RepID=W6QBC3_PENRF|nr:unnamed protein product [Penicillium roqueforti FM164]